MWSEKGGLVKMSEIIQLNGQRFFLRTWGEPKNPVLLLLHGFPEFSGAWEELAPLLSDQFYCVAPDQRGYGQSYRPSDLESYKIHHLVSDVVGILEHIGGSAIVLGHDWGASVAYALAMSHPTMVEKLIIMNGVHPLPFQRALVESPEQIAASQYIHWLRRAGSEQVLVENDFERLRAMFSHGMDMQWLSGEKWDAYRSAWGDVEGVKAMVNWYRATGLYVPKLDEPIEPMPHMEAGEMMIQMPHLLLWGAADTALLPQSYTGLEALAPQLKFASIPDTDHWLHHQKPEAIADIILNWI